MVKNRILDYADDLTIFTKYLESMRTTVISKRRQNNSSQVITKLSNNRDFIYFGLEVSSDNNISTEIRRRITLANRYSFALIYSAEPLKLNYITH